MDEQVDLEIEKSLLDVGRQCRRRVPDWSEVAPTLAEQDEFEESVDQIELAPKPDGSALSRPETKGTRQPRSRLRSLLASPLVKWSAALSLLLVIGGNAILNYRLASERQHWSGEESAAETEALRQHLEARQAAEEARRAAESASYESDRASREVASAKVARLRREIHEILARSQQESNQISSGLAVVSPDGKLIASANGHSVMVWDAPNGKRTHTLSAHSDAVRSVAFSPDSRWLITGSSDKTVRIWDLATGNQAGPTLRNENAVVSVAFSPDGKRVIGKTRDQTIKIWDTRDGTLLETIDGREDTESYAEITDNPFVPVREQPLSTFSIDVDTASYSNVRRFLRAGTLPPPNAVRIEELINYFHYDYPQPRNGEPFSVSMEMADCPWAPEHQLVRIGLQGRKLDKSNRQPANLVFLLDVSGSMSDQNKLPLLKEAMKLLVDQMDERDRLTIVTYADKAALSLDATAGSQHTVIDEAIERLAAGGSTNGSAGIELAYRKAAASFIEGGINRVILATDGDLNVGVTQDDALVNLVQEKARTGVFLTVLGFGTGNLKDSKLESLADNGNGVYAYIDGFGEARKVLVEQMGGSLATIAKDVKLQIEFNPSQVAAYRLIGYENRLLAAGDFADDAKDAGDIGAGHQVTALYEVVPVSREATTSSDEDTSGRSLKYQVKPDKSAVSPPVLTKAADSGELLTLWLRFKHSDENKSIEREFTLRQTDTSFNRAFNDFQFTAAVAAFGMLLRDSPHKGNASIEAVIEIAESSKGADERGYRAEFVELARQAKALLSK